jgi:hypothetical protein
VLGRHRQASFRGDAPHLRLGVVADGKEHVFQFRLAKHAEHVALILALVHALEQMHLAVIAAAQARVVARGQVVGAQPPRIVEQIVEADVTVALQAGVGRHAAAVAVDEKIHHVTLEGLLDVDQVKGNAQFLGHPPRVVDALQAAALVGRAFALPRLRPEAHHHADAVVALLHQQRRRHGRIDPAAHGDDDGGFVRRFGGPQVIIVHTRGIIHEDSRR